MTSGNQVLNNVVVSGLTNQMETVNFVRQPPPSYNEIQMTSIIEETPPIINQVPTIIVQIPFQNQPMYYNCNVCGKRILTRVEFVNTRRTHMFAGFICGLTCWCMLCCLGALPYVIPTFQKAQHYCPNCSNFLGECQKYD